MNLFTNSVIALELATGKLRQGWGVDLTGDGIGDGFFQAVHHDLWDYDWAMNPILYDAKVGGRTIKALAAATKSGIDRNLLGAHLARMDPRAWAGGVSAGLSAGEGLEVRLRQGRTGLAGVP